MVRGRFVIPAGWVLIAGTAFLFDTTGQADASNWFVVLMLALGVITVIAVVYEATGAYDTDE